MTTFDASMEFTEERCRNILDDVGEFPRQHARGDLNSEVCFYLILDLHFHYTIFYKYSRLAS